MLPKLSPAWRVSLGQLAIAVLIAAALGFWLHLVPEVLLVLCIVYIFSLFLQLHRLRTALIDHNRISPKTATGGLWAEFYQLLAQRQRTAYLSKRHLVQRLRAFREAAAALPDAAVILDRTLQIVWFNQAATQLLGLKYPQDIGGYFCNVVRAPYVAEWLTNNNAVSSPSNAPGSSVMVEPLLNVPAPRDESTRLSLHLIHHAPDQALLLARDVTNLMRLEQVRRDFVANVSHELRTPLTVVHGYLDLLDPEQIPEWEPILHELRLQSRRMTQIVEDLLTLSRLEVHSDRADDRIQVRSLLAALLREAQALSQGKHQIHTEHHGEHDLKGSLQELHSAFSNLVSNAVRYTPVGGSITIHWASSDSGGTFAVKDTGSGIAPQYIPRITERFYRVSTSRSRETGGTGLGLSIVKHVLSLHQAKLEIQSEVGVGSTFSCVFGPERLLIPETAATELA